MSENKTKPTTQSVVDYVGSLAPESRKNDIQILVQLISKLTNCEPIMWGSSIIGFGTYHYVYASGREGDAPKIGVSSRKNAITIYGVIFYEIFHENNELLKSLGKHKTGKGCLYISSLNEIDISILSKMVTNAFNTENHTS